jgi:two-component system cell cycle sensor histidine kinase/response regulator CckA
MHEGSSSINRRVSGKAVIRRRWHRLYYVLAAFDIVTVCASFYLGHGVLTIYRESVAVNNAYAERRRAISELDTLAAAVSAPGNDIFETHDVPAEAQKLKKALDEFSRRVSQLREDFQKNLSPEDSPSLLSKLDQVETTVQQIAADSEKLFAAVSAQKTDSTGSLIAAMERKHTFIIKTLGDLRADSRAIERRLFAAQESQARNLQRLEIVIALSVLLMVLGALLYGFKLSRQVESDNDERQQQMERLMAAEADLRSVQVDLEKRVAERTSALAQANEELRKEVADRQRAEAALQKSEEQRQLALNAARLGTWSFDLATDTVVRSDSCAPLFGLKPHEMANTYEGYISRIHPDDRAKTEQHVREALEAGNEYRIEHRVVWPDGSIHWLGEHGTIQRGADGRPRGLAGTIMDITETKQAELALQESEERYRTLFDATFEAIAVHQDGIIIDANPAFTNMFGYSAAEVMGKSVLDFASPESRQRVIDAFKSGSEAPYEATGHKKDGTKLIAELLGKAFIYKGKPARVVALRDITARKHAEQALAENEERYRLLYDKHPQPMWLSNMDTLAFLTVNDQAVKHYGFSREEFQRMTIRDLVPTEDVPTLKANVSRLVPGINHIGVVRQKKKDGTVINAEITTQCMVLNGQRVLLTVSVDVTDRRRAEEALKKSEELYRTLVRNFPNGAVVLFDHDLRYSIADGSGLASVGLSKEAMEGKTIWEVFPPEICRQIEPQYRAALNGQANSLEVTFGSHTYFTYALPVKNERNEILSAMVMTQEITERKQLEDQLRQTQKMEAIGSLAGGVAHDFNNLLMAIMGNCELLKTQVPAGGQLNEEIAQIQDTAMRATALTRQLLTFSRRQVLQPKVLNLNTVVADMERLLRRLIGESIDLRVKLAPDIGAVKADPGQLEQVIMNLAINARDAMPQGGSLTIDTANIEFSVEASQQHGMKPGRYILLSVSDTGCGISPEIKARLFEPFFTTKERGKGTGLGLATVYGIIKQSDGYIWVFSEPGQGAAFKIYLPQVRRASGSHGNLPRTAANPRGNETVLLVEDEDEVRRLTRRMLEQQGYVVLPARTGTEALDISRSHEGCIHLLLSDVVMPGLSGPALAEALLQKRADMKVLYMSGYTDDAILNHGVHTQQTEFLQKPFGAEVLATKVRQVLDGVKE